MSDEVERVDVLAAAAIMVGTLLDALPDDRREWLNGLVERQGQAFPGAERIQRASRAILQEVDEPMSVVGNLNRPDYEDDPDKEQR